MDLTGNDYSAGAAMTDYTTYTLWIVEGDAGQDSAGKDLFSPDSPIDYSDLNPAALLWLTEHGYEDPGRRVVVTPAGEVPKGAVIASYDVAL
ncbi:hypothetical protein [Streptosporangium roseum]|uniref:Uncharacterized protein n=1 Tax=Streptosporangium roseum (strain ATCC 12428 / DSM 43021 / JCM 3005 / KCTC 9067 / NCIMB 10171 / NRRL 2505 / NI 9100) TaxID=479432 RepID=D2AZP0_STRRD|nr:hypothetical protein [Streptosporangium roseum]ACZ85285.1 hypothetical protein Sros_2304 [Streptosporangium roseum DSM 43021]